MAKQSSVEHCADLEKVRRYARILVDLGRVAAQQLDFGGFLDQSVLQVARAVEIGHVKVMQHRPERADLLAVSGTGWKPGVVGRARFPVNLRSAPGRAFQTAQPVLIADIAETPEFKLSPVLVDHGIVALLNVPIQVDGSVWGVLEIDSTEPRPFSQDTVDFMITAATLMGAVIHRHQIAKAETDRAALANAEAQARDLLLSELQHRVKNNLQIILSIVAMQKRKLADGEPQRALDHIANRINAISIAHDQLNPKVGLRTLSLPAYLRALCTAIEQQLDSVAIEVEADEVDLLVDRAVPIGLIVNEAVTNSVKHAFGDQGGRIDVQLTTGIGHGEARLVIGDNGRGMHASHSKGTGSRLIDSLAAQIGGRLKIESSSHGTAVTVEFPVVT